ncbi:PREDICTED: nucleolin-like [Cyprinodon variegatus]|uniref:nucleolin-like n=1 Tax=Cyprinodon variegatus TaxID=28743 RepID=UPI000742C2CC|nr:PREDICTED: nucleolin-like [Cyprinodon variegatus]
MGRVKDHRCLFLKNVPYNATEEDIRKVFRRAVAIRFPGGAKGPSQGIAFVEFKNKAVAEEMLKKKQKAQLQGRDLIVARVQRRAVTNADSKKAKGCSVKGTTLFVSGLTDETTAETLQAAFDGAVAARVAVDKNTGASKRFGFVEFDSEESCRAAKDDMEDCEIDGSKVTVTYAVSKEEGSARPPSGEKLQGERRRHAAEVIKLRS